MVTYAYALTLNVRACPALVVGRSRRYAPSPLIARAIPARQRGRGQRATRAAREASGRACVRCVAGGREDHGVRWFIQRTFRPGSSPVERGK